MIKNKIDEKKNDDKTLDVLELSILALYGTE